MSKPTPDSQPRRHAGVAVETELETLNPQEAAVFLELLGKAMKKRRILLTGYLLALVIALGGIVFTLYVYTNREPGEFVGWVVFVPFVLIGLVLWGFGRWARKLSANIKR